MEAAEWPVSLQTVCLQPTKLYQLGSRKLASGKLKISVRNFHISMSLCLVFLALVCKPVPTPSQ